MGRPGGGKRDRETEREGKGRRLGERPRQEREAEGGRREREADGTVENESSKIIFEASTNAEINNR